MQNRSPDAAIAELAAAQHGVVARRQLLDLGASPEAIRQRLGAGRLHPLHRGVYAVGHPRLTSRGRLMAAVLATGEGAVASHRSAGAEWGLVRHSSAFELTVRRPLRQRRGYRRHYSVLPPDEVTLLDGIPVTTVPRTLLDLASVLSLPRLRNAVSEAEVRRLHDRLSLADLIERYPGRPGTPALRRVLEERRFDDGVARSDLEHLFLSLIDREDLPPPRLNLHIAAGDRLMERDCVWPDHKLIVELDGRATHGTVRAFERDRADDRLLIASGWRVVRVTWRQLRDDPAAVAADVRALLGLARR